MSSSEHNYLWLGGMLLLGFFMGYVFWYDHKEHINNNREWVDKFSAVGIDPRDMTHDEAMWYHKRRSTCVAYGGEYQRGCPRHESYCAGGKTYGDSQMQVDAVRHALENGGSHPECSLMYAGAD